MHCNWPQLTVQQMVNEAWLFTFCHWTHGCDINVVKNYLKRARTCHSATSCVRDQDATAVPARHTWETGSLNWTQFMLHWCIIFPICAQITEFNEISVPFRKNSCFSTISCPLSHREIEPLVLQESKQKRPSILGRSQTNHDPSSSRPSQIRARLPRNYKTETTSTLSHYNLNLIRTV